LACTPSGREVAEINSDVGVTLKIRGGEMGIEIALVVLRLTAACIFAAGSVWLASLGKDGWGWMIFAAIVLGGISYTKTDKGGDER
jgi:hypothetical protein